MRRALGFAAALALAARIAGAQAGTAVPLPEGTEVHVVTTSELSSRTAAAGDPVNFKVDEAITVGGHVLIGQGAMVRGTVSEAKHAGRMGRGGKLNVRVESVTGIDGTRIPLRAARGKAGDDKTGTTVALVVLFGPLGLLKGGKDAVIRTGTPLVVYTDSTMTIHAQ